MPADSFWVFRVAVGSHQKEIGIKKSEESCDLMESVSALTKILDFISKPMNFIIVIALFLTSTTVYLLNFLPMRILEIMKGSVAKLNL